MNKLRQLFDVSPSEYHSVTLEGLITLAQMHEIYKIKTLHDEFFCFGKWQDDWVIRDAYQFGFGYIDEVHINPKYVVSWHKMGPGGERNELSKM